MSGKFFSNSTTDQPFRIVLTDHSAANTRCPVCGFIGTPVSVGVHTAKKHREGKL